MSKSLRNRIASVVFGVFSIVFVFPISESMAVTSCKGSVNDAAILALRGLTVSCLGHKFDVRTFRFFAREEYMFFGVVLAPRGRSQQERHKRLSMK